MTNEELVADIQGGADRFEELFTKNRRLIYKIVVKYRGYEDIDDLMQIAFLGLVEAVKNYDSKAGVLFMSYAPYWIKQAITSHIANNGGGVRLPSYIVDRIRKYKRTVERLEIQGIRYDDNLLCAFMALKPEELEEVKLYALNPVSLDKPVSGYEDDSLTLGDNVSDSKDDIGGVLDSIEREELRRELWGCVDELPADQAEVIHGKYQDGKTFVEMGKKSHSLHDKGLRALRNTKYRKRLLPFMEIYNRGIRGVSVRRFNETWTSATERAALRLI